MTDKRSDGSGGKGFGGFGDLVSDISEDVESVVQPESQAGTTISSKKSVPEVDEAPPEHLASSPLAPSVGSSGAKWVWGIAIGVVVLIVIGNSGKKETPAYTPPVSYESVPAPEPAPAPVPAPVPEAVVSPPIANPTSALLEDKPPVGDGLVFSGEQIRYCLSQKIRIGAIEKIANASRNNEVVAFNTLVSDYNSRCSNFRYRTGSLESISSEINGRRSEIEKAAQSSWIRESLGLISAPTKRTKPDQDQDAMSHGPDQDSTPIKQPSLSPDAGAGTVSPNATSRIPANAHIDYTGRQWECNSGYRPADSECVKVQMPANAHIDYTGRQWECNSGYRPADSECVKVQMPANAHIDYTGRNWECNNGYRPVDNWCQPI